MSDYTGAYLKGVYGVAQPPLKALVSSRCRLLCIKLDYDFYLRKRIPTFYAKKQVSCRNCCCEGLFCLFF